MQASMPLFAMDSMPACLLDFHADDLLCICALLNAPELCGIQHGPFELSPGHSHTLPRLRVVLLLFPASQVTTSLGRFFMGWKSLPGHAAH